MADDANAAKGLVMQNVTVRNTFIDVVFENDQAGAESDMMCNTAKRQVSEPAVHTGGGSKSLHSGYLPGVAELPEPEKESEPNMALASDDAEWTVSTVGLRQMTEETWPTWHGSAGAAGPATGVDVIFENDMLNESSESSTFRQGFVERQMSDCIPSNSAILRQMTDESWPTWGQGAFGGANENPYSTGEPAEAMAPTRKSAPPAPPWEPLPGALSAIYNPDACDDLGPLLRAPANQSSGDLPAFQAYNMPLPANLADALAPPSASGNSKSPKPSMAWNDVTTVMMQNLPNKVTQHMLLLLLDNSGFVHTYDFVYLPIDPDTKANKGYAFINFLNPDLALSFRMLFEGQRFDNFKSDKSLSVAPAALQGFDANYAHYSGARVKRREPGARPLFLREPQKTPQPGRRKPDSLIDLASKNLRKQNKNGSQPAPRQAQPRDAPAAVMAPPPVTKTAGMDVGIPQHASKSRVPRFCPYCGGVFQPNFKFCQFCGSGVTMGAA